MTRSTSLRRNTQGAFQFALDTGASRTVPSSELAAKLAIETRNDRWATCGGGQIEILAGRVRSIAVGKATVDNHAVTVGDFLTMLSTAVGTQLDGSAGYNFLHQVRVTIDYPRQILEFAPAVELGEIPDKQ